MIHACMKKIHLFILFILVVTGAVGQLVNKVIDPVDWVNPLMGTDSRRDFSNGNTYPAIALPWGMNFWTPQTGVMGNGWQYTYSPEASAYDPKGVEYKIRGFKQTHQPSPWMNDYGQFAIMPVSGKLKFREADRASWFSHKAETAKPYYYSVYLADADITTEITPTERAAQFRFTYPKADSSFIVIDGYVNGSYIKVVPGEHKIVGYSTKATRSAIKGLKNYFVIYIDKPFALNYTWHDSTLVKDSLEMMANQAGAVIGFSTTRGETVHLKVASSFISIEQAEINLKRELANDDFEVTKQKAKAVWNKTLNHINIEGGTVDQVKTFYSCFYRAVFFPNKLYEINAENQIVHFSQYNGKVLPGYMYGGTGFWDTFRALYPFLNLVFPSVNKEMQEGLINDYKEGGWLPEWSSPGYANTMIGNNSASVVAEAYIKGLRGYDINTLYEALIKGANNEGPIRAVGRAGVKLYNELGYLPYDSNWKESAACTLEYAYDDFAIYALGKVLKRPEEELALYAKRSLNYRNLFDPETKLMRPKNKNGNFQTPFNPFLWGGSFTEGNSWHYSWSVFHDIQGLVDLMGGKKTFIQMLDSVFLMPPVFDYTAYGRVIHEMREMQVAGMGQYAHGNQPIQHMLYLYNYAGEPWKTQYWVRESMNKLYRPTPDGYCGDEDNGQTSAWYLFSAMGFYPVCPASGQYVVGAPLFTKATIHLENGNQVVINAAANSDKNLYVQKLLVNKSEYNKNWLYHANLQKGMLLDFTMGATPEKTRGTKQEAYPYSLSTDKESPLHK
jgi:predicted alpha-1,2-mannosidase